MKLKTITHFQIKFGFYIRLADGKEPCELMLISKTIRKDIKYDQ